MKTLSTVVMTLVLFIALTHTPASAQQAGNSQVAQESASVPTETKPSSAPTIDPKSLIGEWRGVFGPTGRTLLYMTVENAEGQLIEGKVFVSNPRAGRRARFANRDIPFKGTVDGNRIHIPGFPEFNLIVEGNFIEGKYEAGAERGFVRAMRKL